jgi:hypothetical protein
MYTKPLLPWKAISITYFCVCMRARVRASVCGCGCTSAGVCLGACRVTYPVCHAQAPYPLRPLWLHHIFRYYLINGTIFGRKSPNTKYEFSFSLQFSFEAFLTLRRNRRDIMINVKTSSCKVSVTCWISLKSEFSRQIFEKVSNTKFHQKQSSGS